MGLIRFDNFSFKYYGTEKLALNKVSLTIDRGEYVVITGPSGCGKTTLCRAINALIPQFHRGYIGGHVYVNGMDTREHGVSDFASLVGMVFQNPENQLVTLNVEKELAFGPENLGVEPVEIRRRIEEIIDLLDLKSLREKHPHEMSGGEQQRVAMAAALSLKPEILVADEPTSNLDPQSAEKILEIIAYLNKEKGMTVVLVEHRLDLVAKDATRVILMDKGQIVVDGPPREVLVKDICHEIGVGVPKAVEVYRELIERGIRLPGVPLTGQELATLVQEVAE